MYAADKRSSELATCMITEGFGFDVEAAHAASDKLRSLEAEARTAVEHAVGRPLRSTPTGGISTADLHFAVFKEMKAPILKRSGLTKVPSLGIDVMRLYAMSYRADLQALSLAELARRRARKLRATYIDKVLKLGVMHGDMMRIHPSWKVYGTISGRWSASQPNLQQLPRATNDPTVVWSKNAKGDLEYESGGVRSLYIAKPGYRVVDFDFAQLEMRIAAYISGDPAMISACEAVDLHAANAAIVWGEEFINGTKHRRKQLRQIAKNFGFAICYLAEAGTVYANIIANGESADMRVIEAAIRKLRAKFAIYFRWQDARLREIMRNSYAYSPLLGRRRYLSHTPRPTEAANYHVQSGAADVVNEKLVTIYENLKKSNIRGNIVAMVHDSGISEVHEDDCDRYIELAGETLAKPVTFASGASAVFPVKFSNSVAWS